MNTENPTTQDLVSMAARYRHIENIMKSDKSIYSKHQDILLVISYVEEENLTVIEVEGEEEPGDYSGAFEYEEGR